MSTALSLRILDKKLKIKLAHEIISESKDPLDWYAHGMKLAENGHLNEAVKCFNEVLKEQPLNSDAWYFLGESNEKLGKFNEAMKCYDEAIRVKDIAENAQSEDNQIETTTSVEKVVEDSKPIQEEEDLKPLSSSEIIEKMISTTQKDVEFVKNGRRFERAGNLEEAIKCYDKALQENPENVEAWFNKGKIFEKLGYSELAQEAIDKVYELTKDD